MKAIIYTYDPDTLQVIDAKEVELYSLSNEEIESHIEDVNQVIEF